MFEQKETRLQTDRSQTFSIKIVSFLSEVKGTSVVAKRVVVNVVTDIFY